MGERLLTQPCRDSSVSVVTRVDWREWMAGNGDLNNTEAPAWRTGDSSKAAFEHLLKMAIIDWSRTRNSVLYCTEVVVPF